MPSCRFDLAQVLAMWQDQSSLLVSVTPRYLKEETWQTVTELAEMDKVGGERFREMIISLDLLALSTRPDESTQLQIWLTSFWKAAASSGQEMGL